MVAEAKDVEPPSTDKPAFQLTTLWLVLLIAGGIALRIWVYQSPAGALDSDEAISGLTAKFLLRGESYALLLGLYGGTAEVFLTAPFVALLGPTLVAIRIVPLTLHVIGCILLWRIGRRVTEEHTARLAALIFWIWPPAFIWLSMRQLSFYGISLVCASVVILETLRMYKQARPIDATVLGLALGVGWWSSPQIIFVSVPALVWLVAKNRTVLKLWSFVALSALIGSAPWFWDMATKGIDRLTPKFLAIDDAYFSHLAGYFRQGLPGALGLRVPISGEWLFGPVAGVLYAATAIGFFWVTRRSPRLRPIGWIAAAYPLLFALPPTSFYVDEPRYLYLLGPVLALLLAGVIVKLRMVPIGMAVIIVLTVIGTAKMSTQHFWRGPDVPVPSEFGPLISVLEGNELRRVFADYWVAYRLTFETNESIVATPMGGERYPPYGRLVRATPRPTYVFIEGSETIAPFLEDMAARGIHLEHWEAPQFDIYRPRRSIL
jgi:hypothetical protein